MTSRSLIVLAMALSFVAGTANANDNEKENKVKGAMAAAARVTINQAANTAVQKVPGKVIEAELEKKHNKLIWEVEVVTAENKVMEVHIDADTGAVIDVEEENAKPVRSPKQR